MGATDVLFDVSAFLLFAMEFYHVTAHTMIMCGFRTLPRKDLIRIRFYFLVDCLTVVCSSLLLTQRFQWLMLLHLGQHLFYFITWDKSYMAKKIIDWSSLEYLRKSRGVELDSLLGTLFDIVVHLSMMWAIFPLVNSFKAIMAILVSQVALYSVLFNPRFAWANPRSMPKWVEKRLGKLSLDKNRDEEEEEKVTENGNDQGGQEGKSKAKSK